MSLYRATVLALLGEPFIRLLARKRRGGADAALDRQVAGVLELERLARIPKLDSLAVPAARAMVAGELGALDVRSAPMARVIDTHAGGCPVRIYEPRNAGRHWIVYFHGGGGVIGSIASSEAVTRYLAASTRATVASVEYRLGPEDRHPAAVDDAIAAWIALRARMPADARAAVAGDSFGGYLSVQVDRLARDRAVRPPDIQCLIYPVVDFTLTSPSIERLADGYLLTRSVLHWFRAHYLRGPADERPASPWFWPEVRDSAPAIVATAGYDPLVEEGDAWAARLRAAGVPVRHRRYPSLIHGFVSMGGGVRAARAALDEIAADLRELLGE
ncbi:MAG TPA: alpha/beta hydrolase [Kofleriaceae bacterium]